MVQHPRPEPDQGAAPAYDLVVSLGTDYHHFDRLISWVDSYLAANPHLTCLVQHGFTAPSIHANANVDRMPRAELLRIYECSKVVLVQGGPGSILDAREVGHVPFALPRLSKLDEVVDDHQVEFSRLMETYGEAVVIKDKDDLAHKLDAALADPASVRGSRRLPGAAQAAANLSAAFDTFAPSPGHDLKKFVRRWSQVISGIISR